VKKPAAIRAVIFDLGRVLVQINPARGLIGRLSGLGLGQATTEQVITKLSEHDLFLRYSAGKLTPQEFHREVCTTLGINPNFDEFREIWCAIFEPMPLMPALFADVSARLPVGILSDTDPLHWEYLRDAYPFLQTVACPTLSYEVGATKPDPSMYRTAVDTVGVDAAECLFIDDLQKNVDGAKAAGLQAIVFTDPVKLRTILVSLDVLEN